MSSRASDKDIDYRRMKKDSYYEDSDTESVKSDTSNVTTSSIHSGHSATSGTSMASSQVIFPQRQPRHNLQETTLTLIRRRVTFHVHLIRVEFLRLLPLLKVPEFLDHLDQLTTIINDVELMMNLTNPILRSLLTLLAVLTLVDTGNPTFLEHVLFLVTHRIQVARVALREQRQLHSQSMIRTRRTLTLPNQKSPTLVAETVKKLIPQQQSANWPPSKITVILLIKFLA